MTFLWSSVRRCIADRLSGSIFAVIAVVALLFVRVPTSFVPPKTRATSSARSCCPTRHAPAHREDRRPVQQRLAKDPAIDHMFVAPGRDFIGGGNKPNAGTSFICSSTGTCARKTAPQLAAEVSRMGFTFPTAS
jgi:HAE1 family hydrophobic/amphiphilic exporter-1/multidrug efflux pump